MTGLNVDITADTRQFQAQVENVPTELQKISDQLQQVTQEGDKAGASLESSMRTAQQQTAGSEQVFKSYTDTVVSGTQHQTEAFGLSNTEINRAQREGLKATGSALAQTVAQSATAFDGSVKGALSAVSNISTGIAAFGGPEVAAIAGGVALLTSVVSGMFNKAQQDAAEFQKSVSSLTDSMITSGDGVAAQETRYNAAVKSYTDGTNALGFSFDTMREKAKSLGVPLDTLIAAYSGNAKAADEVRTASQHLIDTYNAVGESGVRVSKQQQTAHDNATRAIDDLKGTSDAQAAAAAGAEAYGRVQTQAAQDAAAAQKQAAADASSAQASFASSLHSSLGSAGQDTKDFSTNGVVDIQKYVDHLNSITQAVQDESKNLTAVAPALTQAGLNYVEGLGTAAAPLLAEAAKLDPASPQYQALMTSWNAAGAAASTNFGSAVRPVVVPLKVDTSGADRDLQAFLTSAGSRYAVKIATQMRTGGPLQ